MKSSRPSVDLNGIKGRVAEALVESIFRRAEYKMTRFGRQSDLRGMLKVGKDESFSPDFLAMKEVMETGDARGIYQTHMIEVKYRSNLVRYLAQEKKEGDKSDLRRSKSGRTSALSLSRTMREKTARAFKLSISAPSSPESFSER